MGQWVGVNLTWRQADLEREFGDKEVQLHESELDTTTVGNFIPFQTGQLDASDTGWDYRSCVGKETDDACIGEADKKQHIPVEHNEPLAFIHTDEAFIADHNDVFNENVSAYLAAIIAEARYKRDDADEQLPEECRKDDEFDFEGCFAEYQNPL